MNRFRKVAKIALFLAAAGLFVQCTAEGSNGKEAPAGNAKGENSATDVKIAYVDGDSLMKGYNLAKDVMEAMLRSQNKLDAAQRQKASEIQRFAGEMDRKYQNNGYLSQASFNADQQKLQQMQGDAQNYMANLQRSIENELAMNNQQLNDSIDKYIAEYAKSKGYAIILRKEATLYIGNVDDITTDIIKGLNERYNKVGTQK